MDEKTDVEEEKTEAERRELDEIKEVLKEHTIVDPIKVKNGTLKIDTNEKIALFEKAFNYENCETLDHENYDPFKTDLKIKDVVMIRDVEDQNRYTIHIEHEQNPQKYFNFWYDENKLVSEDYTMEIYLDEEQAEDLKAWIEDKMEEIE